MSKKRIAVLLSGTGRSLQNLMVAQGDGRLDCEFCLVLSNRRRARGLEIAAAAGIPTAVVSKRSFANGAAFNDEISKTLEAAKPDFIVMAGFLAFYDLPQRWRGKILNIHPSLLPAFGGKGFYGHYVHEAVLEAGVRVTGCTVHFVDNVYDHGPALLQLTCPVLPHDDADSLAARVFERECVALPRALAWVLDGRASLTEDGDRVVFADGFKAAEFS
ncbi:MAG: phosphoribosylglycinamide formyltransferase [Planctomycetota bacterium]